MAYTPFTWADGASGGTPITAARLNALENGLGAAQVAADLDTDVTALAANTASALAVELASTFLRRGDQGEALVSALAIKSGSITVGLAGDSTGNAADEWPTLVLSSLGTDDAELTVTTNYWVPVDSGDPYSGGSYGATSTVQSGVLPDVVDTFTRSGALEGSAADSGDIWEAESASGEGAWTTDGAAAVRSASATTSNLILYVGPCKAVAINDLPWTMTHGGSPASTKDRRIVLAYVDSSNYLYLRIATLTSNALSWSLNKRIGGTVTTLATGSTSSITSSGTPQTPNIDVSYDFTTGEFSATLGADTISSTLSGSDLTTLATGASIAIYASSAASGESIAGITVSKTAPDRTLHLYNGSISGSRLDAQEAILATVFPEPLDLLLISSCHNYTTRTLAEYVAGLDSFLAAFRAHDPDAGIVIMSQNPEKPPYARERITKHLERGAFLRRYAAMNGIGYIPVMEAFLGTPSWESLVASDGIHPTTGASSGAELWRDTVLAYFDAM